LQDAAIVTRVKKLCGKMPQIQNKAIEEGKGTKPAINKMWQPYKNELIHFRPGECRTVLVVGAGASAHLGFPLGAELCSTIISNTRNRESEPFKNLVTMGFSHATILSFHADIEKPFPRSIDEFLSDRSEFIDIGRAAIAQILIACEDEKRLRLRDDNWYGLLRDRIKEEILRNEFRPVIVNFNYDLSLDKFLYDFLSSTFPGRYAAMKSEDDVRVFHVHGRLGYLDYEVTRTPRRSYGKPLSPNEMLLASQGIRIPTQLDNDFGRDMMFAQKVIQEAERVIFIGFGYDDNNLYRLGVDAWEPQKYYGTAYKLGQARIKELMTRSADKLNLGSPGENVFDYLTSADFWKK